MTQPSPSVENTTRESAYDVDELPKKPNLKPREVAEFFEVSLTLIYALIQEGQIPAYKLGSHYRISRRQLLEVIANGLRFEPEF